MTIQNQGRGGIGGGVGEGVEEVIREGSGVRRGRWRWVFGNATTRKQAEERKTTENGFNFWGKQLVTTTWTWCSGRQRQNGGEEDDGKGKNEMEREDLKVNVRSVGWFDVLLHGADRGDITLIVIGTIAAIANGAALPVATIFLGDALNAYNNGSSAMQNGTLPPGLNASGSGMLTLVGNQSLNLLYVGIAGMAAGAIHMFCWMSVCERISAHIRVSYVRALLSQEIAFYDKEAPRELVARLTQDLDLVSNAIGEKVGMLLENMSSFVAGIIIGFVRGPLLALVISACIPALALAAAMMSVLLQSIEKTKKDVYSHGDGIARECLAAIRTVMAFTAEDRSYTRYHHVLSTKTTRMVIRAGFIQGFGMGLVFFVLFSMYAVAMWFGSVQVIHADYTGGQVLTVFFSILIGGFSLGQGAPNFASVTKGVAGAAKIFEIIRREPEMDVTGSSGKAISATEDVHSIVFDNISFAYPTRMDLPIFTNLSMTLATGKTTAIVGGSGSGKSTLLALLQRFYDPLEGRIMINGINLTELNLSDLRRNVFGFVSQDTILFGTLSLYENIRMGIAGSSSDAAAAAAASAITAAEADADDDDDEDGDGDVTDTEDAEKEEEEEEEGARKMTIMPWRRKKLRKKKGGAMAVKHKAPQFSDDDPIIQAARSAFADEFIRKLPEGYATLVGEGGSKISGGQRQRVSIARAMLKRAPILLLDEATSALDAESEHIVQEALNNYGRYDGSDERATIVIVAHRLSTIRNADVVVVLDRALNTIGDTNRDNGNNDDADDHGPDGALAPVRTSTGSYVAESGTHDELMAKENGVYRQLVSLQTSAKTEDNKSSADALQRRSPSSLRNGSRRNTQDQPSVKALPAPSSPADDSADYAVDKASNHEGDHEMDVAKHAPKGKGDEDENDDENEDAAVQQNSSFYQNSYRIFLLSRPDWLFMLIGAISCGIFGAVWPVLGLVLAEIIDVFYETDYDQLEKDASFWAIIFVVLAVVNFLGSTVSQTAFAVVSARLSTRLRSVMFNSALSQELGWHDADVNNSSAVAMRLGGDAEIVAGFLQMQLGMIIQNVVTLVVGLALAFVYSWELTLVVIGLVPLMGLAGYFQFKALSGFSGNTRPMYEEAAVMTSDAVDSIRTVASYTLQDYMTTSYAMRLLLPLQAGRRAAIISGLSHGSSFFLTIGPMALSFYIGAVFVNDGLINFRDVMIVVFVLLYASQGASQAQAAVPDAGRLDYAMKSVFDLMDRESQIDSRSRVDEDDEEADEEEGTSDQEMVVIRGGKTPAPTSASGFDIVLDSVRFSYPTRPEAIIFGDLSLHIEPGCFVAVVGESGSGKSTLLSLLLRFYDVDGGQVCIDGCDIRDINLRWLRSQIAYVQQEPVLFDTTILENIQYGNEECTEEEAIAAARDANAHTFVESFPDAYNTVVGERGMQLSGGQKQRIAIARAIVRKPKLLLLDEATSALDAESEHLVQDALERFRQSRSTVIVAHRLSTVRLADSIAVLKRDLGTALGDPDDKGSYVAECGSHDELMEKENGTYRGLVRLQNIAAQTG